MTPFEQLCQQTAAERQTFMSIPIINHALSQGVTRDLYVQYLEQAYHHVKMTCPLLELALQKSEAGDQLLKKALAEYIDEEVGHDVWILDDIEALGGDREAVANAAPALSTDIMCGYATYAIEHISPYALLGMVHVLEGMSVALALKAAESIKGALGLEGVDSKGFSYLTSHGSLDQEHTAFFETLVNGINDAEKLDVIIRAAKIFYRLYGDIFRELQTRQAEVAHVA